MTKIEKTIPFYNRYVNLILGLMWVSMAIFMFIFNNENGYFVPVLYLLSGSLFLFAGFRNKKRNEEFVAWDSEKVIVAELFKKAKVYYLNEISDLSLTSKHFIVKSENKPSTFLKLKGFSGDDLAVLENRFKFQS